MTRLLIICGPTATGKTAFALELAKKFNGELISADSRQVYREMAIVTGQDQAEIAASGIPVWLYDLVSPDESFSVSQWNHAALLAIDNIHSRGKLPIIVGGTGLYLKSLVADIPTIAIPPDPKLRIELSKLSVSDLFDRLVLSDPSKAHSLNNSDKNNPRRLIRAIEIARSGHPSLRLREGQRVSYSSLSICLSAPFTELDRRIDLRVSDRLKNGALAEIQTLRAKYGLTAPGLTALGFNDDWALSEKHYARRQITWFKKQPGLTWYDITDSDWHDQAINQISNWYNNI
jgi:tRNA dimethylallyltransferase